MDKRKGIGRQTAAALKELESMKTDSAMFLEEELMLRMAALTAQTGREICVYLSRSGRVVYAGIGEEDRADLQDISMRRGSQRLNGLRCIHTHPNGNGKLSGVDEESLKRLRFDAMCAFGVREDGSVTDVSMAVLETPVETRFFRAERAYLIPQAEWLEEIRRAEERIIPEKVQETENNSKEKVMLIGTDETSLEELARLVETAGGEVVYASVQKRAGGIGTGKIRELEQIAHGQKTDLAVYDDELSPVAQKKLEDALGIRVLDRTALILDIFAMRARSSEGKMQVELALLQYRLTRLKGVGTELSRQGGGIGTRGPGEEKLETDKRHINRRIYELREQLERLRKQRALRRRQRSDVPQIALVGYTNAGKSTLLHALSGSDVFCEDKLFATLDPLTRRCELEENMTVCLTDTVGFIRKLPHQLVEAFRSTLEEAVFADVLLHVCDASSPELFTQMEAVERVLTEIGAADIPTVVVLNKADAAEGELPVLRNAVTVSAKTGEGLEELRRVLREKLEDRRRTMTLLVPFSRGDVLAYLHRTCKVTEAIQEENGTRVTFIGSAEDTGRAASMLQG